MIVATLATAGTNTTGAGPLTLILPLALLVVVIAVWWIGMRRRGAHAGEGVTAKRPPGGEAPPG